MDSQSIACGSCGHTWPVARVLSIYGQQALESHPCPRCEAYTLSYRASAREGRLIRHDARRTPPGPRFGTRLLSR